jgi:hypothetical protein
MRYLRKNTAVIVTVGPFYDKTDGVTIKSLLTITNETIALVADTDDGLVPTILITPAFASTTGVNALNYLSSAVGLMNISFSAENTNRLGRMFLTITDAANHVPVFHEFMVIPATVYDSLYLGIANSNSSWQ